MKEYIYYLICPIDNVVRYVGKTKNVKRRYHQHLTKLDKSMTPKRKWLEMLFSKKLKPKCIIVEIVDGDGRTEEQAHVLKNIKTIYNIHNPGKGESVIESNFEQIQK